MVRRPKSQLPYYVGMVLLLLAASAQNSEAQIQKDKLLKTEVHLSPKIELAPGSVSNKNYLSIDFPKGHIAIKSFDAELVDKDGKSAPLTQVYLHHWLLIRYFQSTLNSSLPPIFSRLSGVCDGLSLTQYFGLGSETRRTLSDVPDPYGIVVGGPSDAPAGYEEKFLLNVHAIDTRGVVDKVGCLECACELYNVTKEQDGSPLPRGYQGGLSCCVDEGRCGLKQGYQAGNRTYYLKYTVKYLDWDANIVPVRIYILDVTDIVTKANDSQGISTYRHDCQVEYDVNACSLRNGTVAKTGCIDSRSVSFSLPRGGNFVYGVGHLHLGGTSIALYGQGGRDICTSLPVYGTGHKAGNEAGYVVGMSTCYPKRGSLKIGDGETLTLVSKYDNVKRHTGVMGLFYFLLADS